MAEGRFYECCGCCSNMSPADHDEEAGRHPEPCPNGCNAGKRFCGYPHPGRAGDFRAEDVEHELGAADQHAAGNVHCRTACPTCRAREAARTTGATAAGGGAE